MTVMARVNAVVTQGRRRRSAGEPAENLRRVQSRCEWQHPAWRRRCVGGTGRSTSCGTPTVHSGSGLGKLVAAARAGRATVGRDTYFADARAAYEALPPTTVDALSEPTRMLIASYKRSRSIDFFESLPRLFNGKIDKKALRAPYWQDQNRLVSWSILGFLDRCAKPRQICAR
jgi:hypothetical protein